MNIRQFIEDRTLQAMASIGISADLGAQVRPSMRKEFGDYQINGILPAAKTIKANPRDIATRLLNVLEWQDFADKVEIAGPGFINIFLKSEWISKLCENANADTRTGIPMTTKPKHVVVDMSSPNLAKEMHVGHLRSTIIGDALARIYSFCGHHVTRQNHIGDWGTQFGMLLAYMTKMQNDSHTSIDVELKDLEEFYRKAKKLFDSDPSFQDEARKTVVKFQSGDQDSLTSLGFFVEVSLSHCEEIYRKLNVNLSRSDVRGESFYNSFLPGVIEELKHQNLITEDNGAKCVFLDDFIGRENTPLPIIVQKSDGGYLYMTTDLAALKYRTQTLKADTILIAVDARQSLHLQQLFVLGKKAGFAPQNTNLQHISFGSVLGNDGKPFKTRDGGTAKLADLLTEAENRAYELVKAKNPTLPENELRHIAHAVGVSSVKYADLSKHRTSDYVFNWEQMLSFEGNTAPYMLYAYARIASILRKAEYVDTFSVITITEPSERALALRILQFSEVLQSALDENLPHYICSYLYDLSGLFMTFYEACPILQASTDASKKSRLVLAALTAKSLQIGFDLLGLITLLKM